MNQLLIGTLLALTACGSSNTLPDVVDPIPGYVVDGTWTGTVTNEFITANVQFTLIHNGSTITGELYTGLRGGVLSERGPITGTFDGTTLALKANVELGGVYTFTGPVTGTSYAGTATYPQAASSPAQQATFTTGKQ